MKKLVLYLVFSVVTASNGIQIAAQQVIIINDRDYYDGSAIAQLDEPKLKKINDKDYIIYNVKSGDTWYGIARKFGITYAELRLANKDSNDKITPGREVYIPTGKLKANDPYFQKKYIDSTPAVKPPKETITFHTVKKSQTLFSISKMYNVSVEKIKEWNNLVSNSISVGQKLIVGNKEDDKKSSSANQKENDKTVSFEKIDTVSKKNVYKAPVKTEKDVEVKKPVDKTNENNPTKNQLEIKSEVAVVKPPEPIVDENREKIVFANGREEMNENGIAAWMDDDDNLNTDKYYGLHRTASVGTIIRILNLANSRKIYVKITGKLPETIENEGIIIKISKASAETLGVSGKSFQANLLYGVDKEK